MKGRLIVCVIAVSCLAGPAASATRLYYTDYRYVYAKDLPDGSVETIAEMSGGARPMWVRVYGDTLYWSTYETGAIWCSGLGGQNAHVVVQQSSSAYIRNIEFLDGRMYWAAEGLGALYRADPDGQNIEQVTGGISADSSPVDFDFHDGRIYCVSRYGAMWSCTLSGQDRQPFSLPSPTGEVNAIEIDGGTMYLAADALYSYDMGGSSLSVLSTWAHISGMEVFGDRVYFNDQWEGAIFRCGLDGTGEVTVANAYSWQLTVVPEPGALSLLALGGLAMIRRRRGIWAQGIRRCRGILPSNSDLCAASRTRAVAGGQSHLRRPARLRRREQ